MLDLRRDPLSISYQLYKTYPKLYRGSRHERSPWMMRPFLLWIKYISPSDEEYTKINSTTRNLFLWDLKLIWLILSENSKNVFYIANDNLKWYIHSLMWTILFKPVLFWCDKDHCCASSASRPQQGASPALNEKFNLIMHSRIGKCDN